MGEIMFIFHASNMVVKHPVLIRQNRFLDFGFGFYTTLNHEQAEDFARKVTARRRVGIATVNVYTVDERLLKEECSWLEFKEPDAEWLDFVCANRSNKYTGRQYDLIYGPVANDDVYTTVAAYLNGTFTKEITLAALKVKKLYNQLVFATDKSLELLHFDHAEEI